MKVATLTVEGELSDRLSLRLAHEDDASLQGEVQPAEAGERIRDGGATGRDVLRLVPQDVLRALRQWYHQSARSGTLAIVSNSPALDAIPWERLPDASGLFDLCIVRLLPNAPGSQSRTNAGTALLAAGWIGAPTLMLSGIEKELAALSRLSFPDPGAVRILAEPTVADLRQAWTADRPRCVHIAAPAITYDGEGPKFAISGTEDLVLVPLDEFVSGVPGHGTHLVSLNSCDSASSPGQPSVARLLAERLGVLTVGWQGQIEDLEAADFATYFYSRLLDGDSALESLRRFSRLRSMTSSPDRPTRGAAMPESAAVVAGLDRVESVPVLWTPSIETLGVRPLADLARDDTRAAGTRRRRATANVPASDAAESATVAVDFQPQRWLNPALLKNRRSAILRLVLNADRQLHGVRVSIACDTGAGQSTVAMTLDLARGPQPVAVDDLHFPVLYQLMEQASGRRWVNFTLRCTCDGRVMAETTRAVLWMGRSEWLDRKDMWHFVPAFVDPNAEGVLKVLDEANVLLKRLDPTSAFDGYQRADCQFVRRQVEAIFCCLRDDPFELSYINVPPLEVYLPDESMPTGQQVRTPTQVIERRRGTCHDLAVLMASCMEHIGIHPLIVLKPGHTFAGYWTDLDAWQAFWKSARANPMRLHQDAGRYWTISSVDELTLLVERGDVAPLEATCVTDRNARFEDALAEGRAHLAGPGSLDVAIDVRASRGSIQPV